MNEDYNFHDDIISILENKWQELESQNVNDDHRKESDAFEYLGIRGSKEYWHDFLDTLLFLTDDDSTILSLYFHYANFIIMNHGMFIELRDHIFQEYDVFNKTSNDIQELLSSDLNDDTINDIITYAEYYTQHYIEDFEKNHQSYDIQKLVMLFSTTLRIMLELEVYYFLVLFL